MQFHPSYMFNTSEVSNEYNLLNDFLNNSLMDDGAFYGGNDFHSLFTDASLMNQMDSLNSNSAYSASTSRPPQLLPPPAQNAAGNATSRQAAGVPIDNYVKGYARLNQYMEQNLQQASRIRVLRQLDRFRPKFRERMQSLTDVDLVRIEMWFDKSLMEYDRVFASMAIPACCWRRTGEIYRGNKEMARLIHVPMSKLRDVS